jgi:4-amino-4-deoxy-L-arabinose transferase
VSRFRAAPHPKIANPLGLLVFTLIGLSWYVAVCFRHPDLWSYFLGTEIIARVSSDAVHNRQWFQPFVIYLPLLTLGAGPWLYFGLKLFKQKNLINPTVLWSYLKAKNISSFLLLWLLLPLILFCLVKSRLPLYVLPLYAPIALATARWICRLGGGTSNLPRVVLVALISGLVLVGIKGIAGWYPEKRNMKSLYEMCKALGQNHDQFVVFNSAKLYGLQFYLKGNLKRATENGREPWSDGSMDTLIRKMKNSISAPLYVFISNKAQSPKLYKELRNSSFYVQRYDNDYWYMYLIGNDPGSAHKF